MNQDAVDFLLREMDDQEVDVRDVVHRLGIFRDTYEELLADAPEGETGPERARRLMNKVDDVVSGVEHGGILLARGAIRNVVWRLIAHDKNPMVRLDMLSLQEVGLSPHGKIPLAYAFANAAMDACGYRDKMDDPKVVDEALLQKVGQLIGWQTDWVQRYPSTLEEAHPEKE